MPGVVPAGEGNKIKSHCPLKGHQLRYVLPSKFLPWRTAFDACSAWREPIRETAILQLCDLPVSQHLSKFDQLFLRGTPRSPQENDGGSWAY